MSHQKTKATTTTDPNPNSKRSKKTSHTIAVFHASRKPNAKGEFNWLEWKCVPKVNLACLQEHVGGRVTLLPCRSPLTMDGYALDDGLMDPDFARNDLAGGALDKLGFCGHELLGFAYAGSVVVVGNTKGGNNRGLTEKECAQINDAVATYRAEWNESDEETE